MSPTNDSWSHLSGDGSFLVDLRSENLVLSCRSSTFKRPSILCSVRDSCVGTDDNESLAPLLCNLFNRHVEVSLRGRHIWFVLKGEEINQIIALCIFTSNMRMLEELNRVISQAQVGERLEDLERLSTFNYEKSHVKRGHETDIFQRQKLQTDLYWSKSQRDIYTYCALYIENKKGMAHDRQTLTMSSW